MREPKKKSYVLHLAWLAMTMIGISQLTEPVFAQCFDDYRPRGTLDQNSKSPTAEQIHLGPIVQKLRRYDIVNEIAWSPDGQRLASSSIAEPSITLWDVSTGQLVNQIHKAVADPKAIAFSADSRYLLSASVLSKPGDESTSITLLDGHSGEIIRHLATPEPNGSQNGILSAIAFSPNGACLASGLSNTAANHLSIWRIDSGARVRSYPTIFRSINALDWSADGRFIATVSDDKTLRIWRSDSSELLTEARCDGTCLAVAFSPGGREIAYGSNDFVIIRTLEAETKRQ